VAVNVATAVITRPITASARALAVGDGLTQSAQMTRAGRGFVPLPALVILSLVRLRVRPLRRLGPRARWSARGRSAVGSSHAVPSAPGRGCRTDAPGPVAGRRCRILRRACGAG